MTPLARSWEWGLGSAPSLALRRSSSRLAALRPRRALGRPASSSSIATSPRATSSRATSPSGCRADYDPKGEPYAVLYMHDGQNLFDRRTSGFGKEWGVDEAVTG